MEARDLPLLLASHRFLGESEREPFDRIRLQKAVFLAQMQGPNAWRGLFRFVPYDWGPYSRDLTSRVNELLDDRLMEQVPIPNRAHAGFRATERGETKCAVVLRAMQEPEIDFLRRVREFVTSRSFSQLLRDVYAAYPAYAVASRFKG